MEECMKIVFFKELGNVGMKRPRNGSKCGISDLSYGVNFFYRNAKKYKQERETCREEWKGYKDD